MIIRKFNEKDKQKVLSLINKTLREIFKTEPKNIELDKGLFTKGGVFYVVEEKGRIIGTAGLEKHKKGIARLRRMYIEKNFRGAGLAKKLYTKIQKFAKKEGYKKIILSTAPQMRAAIKFYQKLGFKKYRVYKQTNQIFFYKDI